MRVNAIMPLEIFDNDSIITRRKDRETGFKDGRVLI